jgi:HrpA-like RNA helicase
MKEKMPHHIPSVQQFLTDMLLDAPLEDQIELGFQNLFTAGALTLNSLKDEETKMTWAVRLMSAVPYDMRLSRTIVLCQVFGFLEDSIIMAAECSNPNHALFKNVTPSLLSWFTKVKASKRCYSEEVAIITCYRAWEGLKMSKVKEENLDFDLNSVRNTMLPKMCSTKFEIREKV